MYDYKKIFASLWERPFVCLAIIENNIIRNANRGFCKLVEKQLDMFINQPIDSVFCNIYDFFPESLNTNNIFELPYQDFIGIKIHSEKALNLEFSVIDLSNNNSKILIIRDKTDYINSYNKLLSQNTELVTAFDNITDGIIVTNNHDTIVFCNKIAEKILGQEQNSLQSQYLISIFESLNADYSSYAGKMSISTIFGINGDDGKFVNDTIEITLPDSRKRVLVILSSCIFNTINEVTGYLYIIKDISEQIIVELQLQNTNKMESIGQLAAGIAHEINTPLQYINDNVSFIKDSMQKMQEFNNIILTGNFIKPDKKEELEKLFETYDVEFIRQEIPLAIEQSRFGINKVKKIVSAMKNFAHPGINEKVLSDINQGIKDTITIATNEYKYYADLDLELSENLPGVVCLIDEINQVILNMVINSVHSIKDKIDLGIYEKGKITIKTFFDSENVIIKVYDNGKGIPKNIVNRIFDPFFTTKGVGKGTGQGLSIAYNIITKQHSGFITVESIENQSTEFTITLPINNIEYEKE